MALSLAMVSIIPVYANAGSADTIVIGEYCFKMDNWEDTWRLVVESLDGDTYQVTGYDSAYEYYGYGAVGLNGGGKVRNGHFIFTMQGAGPGFNAVALYTVDINLSTMTGSCDITWIDTGSGIHYANYTDEPIHQISCVAQTQTDNQKSLSGIK